MTNRAKTERKTDVHKAEGLLTIAEVAALDGCSEKTVRRAIDSDLLSAIRIGPGGRMIRISPAAHAAYRALWRR